MHPSNHLPLTREFTLKPLLILAKEIGTPVEKILAQSGLPAHLDGNGTQLVLIPQVMHFLNTLAHIEGVNNCGLLAGTRLPVTELHGMQSCLTGFSNLQDLLNRFVGNGLRFSANNKFRILHRKEHTLLIHLGKRYIEEDVQAQLYQVLGMIQIVRLVAGKNWLPDDISFSFKSRREVEQAVEFGAARIHYCQAHASISIPNRLFALHGPELDSGVSSQHPAFANIPKSFSEGLYELILSYSSENKVDKVKAADLLDISPRTLQRRLATEGTSYLQVHNKARLNKAAQLLKGSDMKLVDIALSLGFENASSFTRAFHLWTGVTPREYRKQLCELAH